MEKLEELKKDFRKDLEPLLGNLPKNLADYIDALVDRAFVLGEREMIREMKSKYEKTS